MPYQGRNPPTTPKPTTPGDWKWSGSGWFDSKGDVESVKWAMREGADVVNPPSFLDRNAGKLLVGAIGAGLAAPALFGGAGGAAGGAGGGTFGMSPLGAEAAFGGGAWAPTLGSMAGGASMAPVAGGKSMGWLSSLAPDIIKGGLGLLGQRDANKQTDKQLQYMMSKDAQDRADYMASQDKQLAYENAKYAADAEQQKYAQQFQMWRAMTATGQLPRNTPPPQPPAAFQFNPAQNASNTAVPRTLGSMAAPTRATQTQAPATPWNWGAGDTRQNYGPNTLGAMARRTV